MKNLNKELKSILLKGAPGTGKTSLVEYFANKISAEFIYLLFHEWTTQEELFHSIDVGKVAMRSPYPYTEGVLLKAVKMSWKEPVVLCLDEIDKAKDRVDVLLLDFLQNYRVTDPEGNLVKGNPDNIYVWITSNNKREVIDPLARRVAKANLDYLPPEIETKIILGNSDEYYLDTKRKFLLRYMKQELPKIENENIAKYLVKIANKLRVLEIDVSASELKNLYKTLFLCESREECKIATEMWLIRNEEALEAIDSAFKGGLESVVNTLWGMIKKNM